MQEPDVNLAVVRLPVCRGRAALLAADVAGAARSWLLADNSSLACICALPRGEPCAGGVRLRKRSRSAVQSKPATRSKTVPGG